MTDTLSRFEARRMALAAHGFSNTPRLRKRHPFDPALSALHVLQIDSVNVFERSHYLPIFSRHGAYRHIELDDLLWHSGQFTEYWAHEAAFIRTEDRPLFAWRMQDYRERFEHNGRAETLRKVTDRVRSALAERGPSRVREIEPGKASNRGEWWDWSDTKKAVEQLFATGEVVSVGRERFERRYALASDALPAHLLAQPPSRKDAQRSLIEQAGRSLGVASLADLADYHRMSKTDAQHAVKDLEAEGTLLPVTVDGWSTRTGSPLEAWVHHEAHLPRSLEPDALLTPFDPVCWYRPRAERLFGFHYRLEIYTPAAKRKFGYYSLPLMVDGALVGRLDLKAARSEKTLLVQSAWREEDAPAHTAEVATALLREAAAWQQLDAVQFTGTGSLNLDPWL